MNKFFDKINPRLQEYKVFQNAYYWLIAPLVIVFIALVCGTIYNTQGNKYDGFANIGTDFKGGTVLTVEMTGADMINKNYAKNEEIIRAIIEEHGAKVSTVQTSGTNAMVMRYPNSINGENYNSADKTEEMNQINHQIAHDIEVRLRAEYGSSIIVSADAELTNATASKELINKAILSILITMVVVLIYIIIRFDLFSGIAAILALLHDIIIMLALVIIFNIQINSSLIAGIITIVSYSINNTIVVFDRVRENIAPYKSKKARFDIRSIVNTSVGDIITRSLFTTFTTFVTITVLASVGVKALTEFALPIIFGLIAGLYSSVLIAPSIWGLMMQAKLDAGGKGGKKQNKNSRQARARATR